MFKKQKSASRHGQAVALACMPGKKEKWFRAMFWTLLKDITSEDTNRKFKLMEHREQGPRIVFVDWEAVMDSESLAGFWQTLGTSRPAELASCGASARSKLN